MDTATIVLATVAAFAFGLYVATEIDWRVKD